MRLSFELRWRKQCRHRTTQPPTHSSTHYPVVGETPWGAEDGARLFNSKFAALPHDNHDDNNDNVAADADADNWWLLHLMQILIRVK